MTKRDLVLRIAAQSGLNQRDIATVVQLMLDNVTSELAAGRGVEFRNFGVFSVKKRAARIGRNPNMPARDVVIPEEAVVKFKAGKTMKERVGKLIEHSDPT